MSLWIKNGLAYSPLIIAVVLIDQITKYLCVNFIDYNDSGVEVLPFFNLVHVYNYGAAFSFLANMGGWQRWFFAIIAIVIAVAFLVLLYKTPKSQKLLCVSYALFIGGALGNLIDRLIHGYVIDFLLFYLITDHGVWSYPAFNVADIAVCSGAFLLIYCSFFTKNK